MEQRVLNDLKMQMATWVEWAERRVSPSPPAAHSHRSPVADARRFALLTCFVALVAGYAYVEEYTARTVRSTSLWFERVFRAHSDMENALRAGRTGLQEDQWEVGRPSSLKESPLTDAVRIARHTDAELVSDAYSGAPFCDVRHYHVTLPESWSTATDGDFLHSPTTVSASLALYHLMEFPPYCHFEGGRNTYVLVGFFEHGEEQYQPGVLFDSGGLLLYGEVSRLQELFLAMASSVTGRQYSSAGYDTAVNDLLFAPGSVVAPPTFFGFPIPMEQVVIALPLSLFLLAVAFLHRVRRMHDAREPVWLLSHSYGCIEKTIAATWKVALCLSGPVVYCAANLYLDLGARVQEARATQFAFAPERGVIVRWLQEPTDISSYYAVAMCGLATVVNFLGIVVLAARGRKADQPDTKGEADQKPDATDKERTDQRPAGESGGEGVAETDVVEEAPPEAREGQPTRATAPDGSPG